MKFLLDTHVALSVIEQTLSSKFPQFAKAIQSPGNGIHVSVVSLWEIAIKVRICKLTSRVALTDLPALLTRQGVRLLPMTPDHAVTELSPEPATKDPFDRLLLVQADIEGMRFLTVDRALADHPVTFRG